MAESNTRGVPVLWRATPWGSCGFGWRVHARRLDACSAAVLQLRDGAGAAAEGVLDAPLSWAEEEGLGLASRQPAGCKKMQSITFYEIFDLQPASNGSVPKHHKITICGRGLHCSWLFLYRGNDRWSHLQTCSHCLQLWQQLGFQSPPLDRHCKDSFVSSCRSMRFLVWSCCRKDATLSFSWKLLFLGFVHCSCLQNTW